MGNKIIGWLSKMTTSSREVLPDISLMRFTILNAFLIGDPNDREDGWVLVDPY